MKKEVIKQLIKRPTKRIRILGALLLLVSFTSVFSYYLSVVSPSFANAYSGRGVGSDFDPYRISNCDQLQEMKLHTQSQFVLVNDIDCSATSSWNDGAGFEPVIFNGSLDGRNYAINDFYINRPDSYAVGLFSVVEQNSVVENLRFEKSDANQDRIDILGSSNVGSLAGEFRGNVIRNVHTNLNVQTRSTVASSGAGGGSLIGGLVGVLRANVEHSSSTGDVSVQDNNLTGRNTQIGGLIGSFDDYERGGSSLVISDSFTTSKVTIGNGDNLPAGVCAGFVAIVSSRAANTTMKVQNSYSAGEVDCVNPNESITVAGFVGYASADSNATILPVFNYNFSATKVEAAGTAGQAFYGNLFWENDIPGSFNFENNAYDATKSGIVTISESVDINCGNRVELQCIRANVNNAEPDYFSETNNSGFYTSWEQVQHWQLGSSYPTLKEQAARTNAPTNIAVSRDGQDFILNWDIPSGDSTRTKDINGYQIFYKAHNTSNNYQEYQISLSNLDDTARLVGFDIPGSYDFLVRAKYRLPNNPNIDVPGILSDLYNFATGMPENAPDAIEIEAGGKSARITWDAVNTASSYGVQYRQAGTESWLTPIVIEQNDRFALIYDLTPMTAYEVRVVGRNVAGNGPWSDVQNFNTIAQRTYTIGNCQELQAVNDDLEGIYSLSQDIDCSNVDFQPIGAPPNVFTGVFDGRGFKISNLSILKELTLGQSADFTGIGLFATTYGATIQNVTLADSNVVVNYVLADDADTDQNGLPDAPLITVPDIEIPDNLPGTIVDGSTEDLLNEANDTAGSVTGAGTSLISQAATASGLIGEKYAAFAKISVGSVVGVAVGEGNYSNIRTQNTTVRGGIAGGVFGMLLPLRSFATAPDLNNIDLGGPITISNIHSEGLVAGNSAGGLIGIALSSLANAVNQPGDLTIADSSSSSEVQANVGGGIVGMGLGTSGFSILLATIGASNDYSTFSDALSDAITQTVSSQDIIIKNTFNTGKISACDAPSGIRAGALGGIVGAGLGVSVEGSSYNSGKIDVCSATETNVGVYGGLMGGIGGVMLFSRITDSHNSGNIEAINNDTPDQHSQVNTLIAVTGGLTGLTLSAADDADGRYAVNNSYSTGDTKLDSKYGTGAFSGGLNGIYLGGGTIKSSHSTGNITHRMTDKFVGGLSIAGGINAITIGIDGPYVAKFGINFTSAPAVTHGFNIDNSYATGNIGVQKDKGGGNLSVGGGLMGVFIGQGTVSNSYATGNVSGGLPDQVKVKGSLQNIRGIISDTDTQYGAAVSGGLIGATFGIDVPKFLTTLLTGLTQTQLDEKTTQGIVVQNAHASGNVRGNLAGGLIGSADLKTDINKSYAEGDVDGAIVGGLVGQAGFMGTVASAGLGTFMGIISADSDGNDIAGLPAIGRLSDRGMASFSPVRITNTYTTGNVTATPGLSETNFTDDNDARIPVDPVRLPATAGGIAGMFVSAGGKIADSYASGDLTVKADQFDPGPLQTNGERIQIGKVPSIAGGVVGLNIAIGMPSLEAIVTDAVDPQSLNTSNPNSNSDPSKYMAYPQVIENVFSASKVSLNSETLSGGSIGLIVSPLHFINTMVIGNPPSKLKVDNVYAFKNIHIDKSRVSVSNCNGPNKGILEASAPIYNGSFIPGDEGENIVSQGDPRNTTALSDDLRKAIDANFNIQTACQYVNDSNSQPRYFIQNNINEPIDKWNFSDVWVIKKDDYPKFVAGASTCEADCLPPGQPLNPTYPIPTNNEVPTESRELLRNVARKLNFRSDQQRVKGLKELLAAVPAFLARSLPYAMILLLLMLATLYASQAYRQYRQLKIFHDAVMRVVGTKEAIDNYLAITTHYLNTPVAVMGGAVELLTSLKKISETKADSLQARIKGLRDDSAALLTANQVSNSQTANDEHILKEKPQNPFTAKAVWIPAAVALFLIVLANILFIYAEVFNRSIYRMLVEFGLYVLSVFLIGLAYRYRNFLEDTKKINQKQLAQETELYKKRMKFIPEAQKVIGDNYQKLVVTSEPLKKVPEAKLFFNGLAMLAHINKSLSGIRKYSEITDKAPLFDVTSCVRKAVADARDDAHAKKITIDARIQPGMVAHIQPEEVKQLADSLINNAIKFSKDGGNVRVLLFKRFNKLVLSVADDGIGISEQKLPSLLKPFSRGTNSIQYNYEGIGLDLYSDKVIMDKLGGSMNITSKLDAGTTVTVSMPANRQAAVVVPVLVTPETA